MHRGGEKDLAKYAQGPTRGVPIAMRNERVVHVVEEGKVPISRYVPVEGIEGIKERGVDPGLCQWDSGSRLHAGGVLEMVPVPEVEGAGAPLVIHAMRVHQSESNHGKGARIFEGVRKVLSSPARARSIQSTPCEAFSRPAEFNETL